MDTRRKTVLVVDDEPSMLDALRRHLDESAFDVRTTQDGQEALDLIAEGEVDLVVNDPAARRCGGFMLLEVLSARAEKPPVIVTTGLVAVEMSLQAMRLGAADFLLKPCEPLRLVERVRDILAAPPGVAPAYWPAAL